MRFRKREGDFWGGSYKGLEVLEALDTLDDLDILEVLEILDSLDILYFLGGVNLLLV